MPVEKESAEALVGRMLDNKVASHVGATVCNQCGRPPLQCGCINFSSRPEAGSHQHNWLLHEAHRSHQGNIIVRFMCGGCPEKGEVNVPNGSY